MAKKIKLRILINFEDKENKTKYKRNDEVIFTEKRAMELLKNPCLVEKVEEIEEQNEEKVKEQEEIKTEK